MQDRVYGLPRTPLLGNSVNKRSGCALRELGFREGDPEGDPEGNTRPEMGSVSAVPPVVQREAAGISPLPFLLPRALLMLATES
jgi:hypothetical protein